MYIKCYKRKLKKYVFLKIVIPIFDMLITKVQLEKHNSKAAFDLFLYIY